MLELRAEVNVGPVFLDSGAYGVHTGQMGRIDIRGYVDLVVRCESRLALIAMPDVIGSNEKTLRNLVEFRLELERRGNWELVRERVLAAIQSSDLSSPAVRRILRFSRESGIDWVGFGGVVASGKSNEAVFVQLDYLVNLMTKELPNAKLHLFGGSSPVWMRVVVPNSVDSSVFIQKARNMTALDYRPEGLGVGGFPVPKDEKDQRIMLEKRLEKTASCLPEGWSEQKILDEMRGMSHAKRLWVVNALEILWWEQWVRKNRSREFRYFVSATKKIVRSVGKNSSMLGKLMEFILYGRCLVSFADIENGIYREEDF